MLRIGTVYDNGLFPQMPEHPGKAYFEFPCQRRVVIQPGDLLPLQGGSQSSDRPVTRLRCLAARKLFVEPASDAVVDTQRCQQGRSKDRDGSDNANSIVMLLEYGPFRFYDGGDITWNQERKLVCPVDLIGKVDVYQVTHHGLDSSNNPLVLQAIQPRVAIMNNGHTKGCMPEVFANLTTLPSLEALYQVHKNLRPDGLINNVETARIANLEPPERCQANHIRLSVAVDGKHFTVYVPSRGHRRTFTTQAAVP